MKNTNKVKAMLRIAGVIAFVAVIVFSFVSCDDNIGGGTGDNLQVSMPVTYSNDYVTNIAAARAARDFSYYLYTFSDSAVSNDIVYEAIPLSTLITGSPRVEITGGTVNIQLGKPKYFIDEVGPNGLKIFVAITFFCTSNAKYFLICAKDMKDISNSALLPVYADRDGTMEVWDKDIFGDPIGKPYYLPIKRGWSWGKTGRLPSIYTTIPPGYEWIVVETSIWEEMMKD